MESLGVLLLRPLDTYLEQELDRRCRLLRLWDAPHDSRGEFTPRRSGPWSPALAAAPAATRSSSTRSRGSRSSRATPSASTTSTSPGAASAGSGSPTPPTCTPTTSRTLPWASPSTLPAGSHTPTAKSAPACGRPTMATMVSPISGRPLERHDTLSQRKTCVLPDAHLRLLHNLALGSCGSSLIEYLGSLLKMRILVVAPLVVGLPLPELVQSPPPPPLCARPPGSIVGPVASSLRSPPGSISGPAASSLWLSAQPVRRRSHDLLLAPAVARQPNSCSAVALQLDSVAAQIRPTPAPSQVPSPPLPTPVQLLCHPTPPSPPPNSSDAAQHCCRHYCAIGAPALTVQHATLNCDCE
ncbi:uncharacterized protein [Miscanthus floridulus]|uniref:uncharacterized protein n=1 Tax=Miscanthus floridulus TaxID=154761 RepID=UPI00345ACE9B